MATNRQSQTPNKNVGGQQITDREARLRETGPAQREAVRRAGEPAIDMGPEGDMPGDDPARRISANKRGGGSHGGSSKR